MAICKSYMETMPSTNDSRVSRPVLTRYERASIMGRRMEQLQRGAIPFVEIPAGTSTNAHDVALLELEQRKLPFIVVRKLPDGKKEEWRLSELLG